MKERAPLLAKVELDLHLISTDLALSEQGWKQLVNEYWMRWGSKGSIVPELEAIAGSRTAWVQEMVEIRIAEGQVSSFNREHIDQGLTERLMRIHIDNLSMPTSIFYVRRRQIGLQVKRILSDTGNSTLMVSYTVHPLPRLESKADRSGKNLPHTDIQPADEIGLATVQLILTTSTSTAPLRASLALEYMLSKSPSCAYAKFLLIRLYRLIGALPLVKPILEQLKPSEVQLDTLLHIWIEGGATDAILAPTPLGQDISAWERWTGSMEKMYNRSATDVRSPLFLHLDGFDAMSERCRG